MKIKSSPMGKTKYAGECHGCGAESENMGNQGLHGFKKKHQECDGEVETWKMKVPEVFGLRYIAKNHDISESREDSMKKILKSFDWRTSCPLAIWDEDTGILYLLTLRDKVRAMDLFEISMEEVDDVEYTYYAELCEEFDYDARSVKR